MARQAMSTAIGRGLNRAAGIVATSGASPVDVRNVYARDAKMALRGGLSLTGFPALSWGTDIIGGWGVKATLDLLLVAYDRNTHELRIYRLDPVNGVMQTLAGNGRWGFATGGATSFPVLSIAEADGNVFFAHDEADIATRLTNVYYTPDFITPSNPGVLTALTADLDGDGVAVATQFRGFYAHLEYMVGWGYGSEADADRGDILRLSMPAQSTQWRPGDYALCGVRRDPIVAAVSCRQSVDTPAVLALLKPDQSYKLVGTSPDDFGIEDLDFSFGAVSSRVVVTDGQQSFTWASDGPRVVTPAGTQPIGAPLELLSPLPADFPPLGPARLAFATYDQDRALLRWCFPDVESGALPVPCFDLSLWNPEDPRWTFAEIFQPVTCAFRQLARDVGGPGIPPTGYPSALALSDNGLAVDHTRRIVRVAWTNNGEDGDELVQLLVRPLGGAWSLAATFAVQVGDQVANWATALPVTFYDVAMRYIRGGATTVGYESSDPALWTAATAPGSKGTVSTSSAPVAWGPAAFSDAATPINLTWTSQQVGAPYLLEKDPGTGYVTVAADLVATSYSYAIPPAELGTTVNFRLTAQRGAVVGPTAGVLPVAMKIVVAQPVFVSATFASATAIVSLVWNPAADAFQYLVEKSDDGGATWVPIATGNATSYDYPITPAEVDQNVDFRVTGQNGVFSSIPSAVQVVNCGVLLVAPVIVSAPPASGPSVTVTWNLGAGPFVKQTVRATITGHAMNLLQNDVAVGATTYDFDCDGFFLQNFPTPFAPLVVHFVVRAQTILAGLFIDSAPFASSVG
jgi:hypothetical protein